MEQYLTLAFIFFARVIDVSIGTFRIILISQGHRNIAPLLGFVEILVWLNAIGMVLNNLSGVSSYIIYAAGFATGNYVGMLLESKFSIGYQSLRIITSEKITALPMALKDEGYEISIVNGKGTKGEILLIYTVVPRRKIKRIMEITRAIEPNAFITIEDVRSHDSNFLISRKKFFDLFGRQIVKKK